LRGAYNADKTIFLARITELENCLLDKE
jgi:chromosome segregation ATPase